MWYGNPKTGNALKVVRVLKNGKVRTRNRYGLENMHTEQQLAECGWKRYDRKPSYAVRSWT